MKPAQFYPVHPGEVLQNEITSAGVTQQNAADSIGITRSNLNLIINGHASLSSEMAVRLSKAFGQTAQFWLNLQMQWDLSKIDVSQLKVIRLKK